jgi:hypothetical protein
MACLPPTPSLAGGISSPELIRLLKVAGVLKQAGLPKQF